ncbi:MAG: hypothetical protein HYT81_13390 [Gemmatimonadetes bacterium]|nr:hypothetical protein [Gemmatimonadota bacterium]
MRRAAMLVVMALVAPGWAAAQNSVYGLIGIGFPGEPLAVRARSLGGGIGALDPTSALNPATVAGLGRLVAGGAAGTTLRRYTAGDSTVSGLRETRFPYGMFGGRIPSTPLSFAVSFSTYAERTYDVTTTGTQVLRGDTLEVTDRVASDGAVTDFRGALAFRPWPRLLVGGAFHLLGGSSRLTVGRTFSSSDYSPYVERSQLVFSGTGVSAGVVLLPTGAIELAASARVDGDLETKSGTLGAGSVRLPVTLSGGVRLTPVPGLSLSSTAVRRSWSRAQPDLLAPSRAFDTWEIGSGIELSRPRARGATLPIRVGYRYRQLPFSNVATQATESVFTGGTGAVLAGGRASLDASVERFHRSGGGADERGWYFSLGVILIP